MTPISKPILLVCLLSVAAGAASCAKSQPANLPAPERREVPGDAATMRLSFSPIVKRTAPAVVKTGLVAKDLWDVACLAELLSRLGYAHSSAVWEAEYEGDGSKVPGMLAEALRQLASAFEAMAAEEVAEMLAGHGVEVGEEDSGVVEASFSPKIKVWRGLRAKAGRVLSQANQDLVDKVAKCLDKMADCHVKAADSHDEAGEALADLRGHLDEATKSLKSIGKKKPKTPSDDDGDGAAEDPNTDDSQGDNPESDVELAAQVGRRKREIEIAALAAP